MRNVRNQFRQTIISVKNESAEKNNFFIRSLNIWNCTLDFDHVLENITFLLCFIVFYAVFVKKTGLWVGI